MFHRSRLKTTSISFATEGAKPSSTTGRMWWRYSLMNRTSAWAPNWRARRTDVSSAAPDDFGPKGGYEDVLHGQPANPPSSLDSAFPSLKSARSRHTVIRPSRGGTVRRAAIPTRNGRGWRWGSFDDGRDNRLSLHIAIGRGCR